MVATPAMDDFISKLSRHRSKEGVKSVLVVNDFYRAFNNERVDINRIRQVYLLLFCLDHFCGHLDNIILSDQSGADYSIIWKSDSPLKNYINRFLTRKRWHELSFMKYDIIICGSRLDSELIRFLERDHLDHIRSGGKLPGTYSFHKLDYEEKPIFQPLHTFISELLPLNYLESDELRSFNALLSEDFIPIEAAAAESAHPMLLERIVKNNSNLRTREIRTVLILDDYLKKFYIGDSYWWFSSYKKNIISILPEAFLVLNCDNLRLFNLLSPLYALSFGPNVQFQNKDWSEIDFLEFDLILCEIGSLSKLFGHLKDNYAARLNDIRVFHFSAARPGEMQNAFSLDYKDLFETLRKQHFLSSFHSLRRRRFGEIVVPPSEILRADKWLVDNGLLGGDKVIVFTNSASVKEKLLDHDVYCKIISWFAQLCKVKVLIFDETKAHIRQSLSENLLPVVIANIIVAEGFSLQDSMYLLASNHVRAVIGPCTGILHLANGIYQYIKNGKLRSQLPALITYTGNLSKVDTEYHPGRWWAGSLVKCMVIVRDKNGCKAIKELDLVPKDIDEYNEVSLPVREYTTALMISYLSDLYQSISSNVCGGDR